MESKTANLVILALGVALLTSCGRQSAPIAASMAVPVSDGGPLPFDRAAGQPGISPTSAVIPPYAQVPAGTPVTIRLSEALSSATAHPGDTFRGAVAQPVIVNGRTVIERGAVVMGRVLDAAAGGSSRSSGYVRLALATILIRKMPVTVQSSNTLVKASAIGVLNSSRKFPVEDAASPGHFPPAAKGVSRVRDVTVEADRSLTFRLREPVTLDE